MAVNDSRSYLPIRFNSNYSENFDEIINCQITNRKSDSGLIDRNKPMLRPRAGSYRIGNELISTYVSTTAYAIWDFVEYQGVTYKALAATTGSTPSSTNVNWSVVTQWNVDGIFYTDRSRTRRMYRVWNKKLWYLNGTTWTQLKDLQTDSVKLQIQRLPINLSWALPTSYTTPSTATTTERVRKDASDTGGASNIGKILMVTSGTYKWAFASITDYVSGTSEYVTWWAGIITALPASVTYVVCDTLWDCLQICRWYESNSSFNNDIYFNGIIEQTQYQGFATAALRLVSALWPTEWIRRSASYLNKVWSFSGATLFYSGWLPWNPFFYDFTGAISVGWAWEIIDIFPFKNRLIVIGTSFIYALNSSLTFDKLVDAYGGILNGVVSTGEDVYIVTTQWTLISINETISWFVELKNIARDVDNYIKDFKANVSAAFDGRYMYIYWDSWTIWTWVICVYDIRYKFWSIFSGIYPVKIIPEQSTVYVFDNNSDVVRALSLLYTTDVLVGTGRSANVSQLLSLKEIDRWDIFTMHSMMELYFSFENYSQSVNIDTYMGIDGKNAKKNTVKFDIAEIPIANAYIGNNIVGNNEFGGQQMLQEISVPLIRKVMYKSDHANIWKVYISGSDGSFFYLNAIDIEISNHWDPKQYFGSVQTK